MRSVIIIGIVACIGATAAHAQQFPARKPGLWKQTMVSKGQTIASTLCLDTATDRKLSIIGQQMGAQTCSKNTVRPLPGGFAFESVCSSSGTGTISSKGAVTGNFNSRYEMKSRSTISGAKMAMMNGTSDMTMTAVWAGACPAGMAPGDMTMPGGIKVNVLKMTGGPGR